MNHGHMITATGQYLANVKCSECGVASRVVWSTDSPEEAVKEAIEAWNRRAESERKKGEWIEYPDCLGYDGAYSDDQIVCSECHHVFSILDNCTEEFDFCPSCGADMRGEDEKA